MPALPVCQLSILIIQASVSDRTLGGGGGISLSRNLMYVFPLTESNYSTSGPRYYSGLVWSEILVPVGFPGNLELLSVWFPELAPLPTQSLKALGAVQSLCFLCTVQNAGMCGRLYDLA